MNSSPGPATPTQGHLMGDRSPKANQKQKSQQAAKSAGVSAQKQKAILAKQVVAKK
ncbi:MAG: hypothetical protein SFU85_05140 [Candidatus Methylacidiphilales bacterium]|nr:hypothetical protein [Candidatus Methylacidiphilales bacterium]